MIYQFSFALWFGQPFKELKYWTSKPDLYNSCNVFCVIFFSYILHQSDKGYAMYIDGKPTGWFHLTIVYHGDGNDVDIYYDGQRKDTFSPGSSTVPSGSGHTVIGRQFIDQDNYYATVEIDELTLWNS